MEFSSLLLHNQGQKMPKAGKKNHIFGDFFSEATKKKRENGEGIRYRRKESPIPHQKWKNPLDFCSISDRSVPLGVALLPWVSITALASSGVKPTLGSKAPPSGTLLPEMEKKSSGFFISDEGKRHSLANKEKRTKIVSKPLKESLYFFVRRRRTLF